MFDKEGEVLVVELEGAGSEVAQTEHQKLCLFQVIYLIKQRSNKCHKQKL